jgi:hypothetical protein
VLGRDFDHAVLAAAMRPSPEIALEALDAAVAAGLSAADRAISFRFVHDVVRDAVASQLPPSRRAAAHHAVFSALRTTGWGQASDLAHHAIQARHMLVGDGRRAHRGRCRHEPPRAANAPRQEPAPRRADRRCP